MCLPIAGRRIACRRRSATAGHAAGGPLPPTRFPPAPPPPVALPPPPFPTVPPLPVLPPLVPPTPIVPLPAALHPRRFHLRRHHQPRFRRRRFPRSRQRQRFRCHFRRARRPTGRSALCRAVDATIRRGRGSTSIATRPLPAAAALRFQNPGRNFRPPGCHLPQTRLARQPERRQCLPRFRQKQERRSAASGTSAPDGLLPVLLLQFVQPSSTGRSRRGWPTAQAGTWHGISGDTLARMRD